MQPTATVLVYSDDSNTREQVRLATGRRPAPDVPVVQFVECATPEAAVTLPVEPVEFAGALASLLRTKRLQSA
jgi:hypothetical protein